MDIVLLSRWQFALTTIYHFFFVPLTLGLGWLVAILETLYVVKKNELYKKLTKFLGKLFLINYAMGVVTGIVMEFQFGMNWSEYSRFVGDVFGAPLAIEGLLAFFLESTFLGVWIFGWERLSKKLHAAVMWLVALGGNLECLLDPGGQRLHAKPGGIRDLVDGRAQMVDFGALLLNPRAWYLFAHTISSGLVTAAFFMLGISVYHLVKKQDEDAFKISFRLAAIVGVDRHHAGGGDRARPGDLPARSAAHGSRCLRGALRNPGPGGLVDDRPVRQDRQEGDLGDQDPQGVELPCITSSLAARWKESTTSRRSMKQNTVPEITCPWWRWITGCSA